MKELTWKDTISIMRAMFDLTQEGLSDILGVHAATISRLVRGETENSKSLKIREVYSNLFAPNSKANRANNDEETLLELLKGAIEENGFKEVMKDSWDKEYAKGDYEAFVMKMLKRTKANQSAEELPSPEIDINDPNDQNKNEAELFNKKSYSQMLKIFMQIMQEFPLCYFMQSLNNNKTADLQDFKIRVAQIHTKIEKDIIKPFEKEFSLNPTYKNIQKFNNEIHSKVMAAKRIKNTTYKASKNKDYHWSNYINSDFKLTHTLFDEILSEVFYSTRAGRVVLVRF